MSDGTDRAVDQAPSRARGRQAADKMGFDVFRVGGIQVAIDPSWLVVFFLVLWSLSAGYFPAQFPGRTWTAYIAVGFVSTLLFFASVLVHELSHAFVGNSLGEEVRRITLFIFGGMAHLSGEPRSPGAEFKIAAVGPATSIGLGLLFLAVKALAATAGVPDLWVAMFGYLGIINIALAVFNLLPGYPLDGGRLLRAYFWSRSGDLRQATARAADWGTGIATGLMILGALQIFAGGLVGGLWLIFIAMFLRGAARAGHLSVVTEQNLADARVRDLMVDDPVTVSPAMSLADAVHDVFLRHGFTGYPVAENGRTLGVIGLADIQRCPPEERVRRNVADFMRSLDESISIHPDAPLLDALRKMNENDNGRLLVMDGGRLAGFLTRSGIARFTQLRMALEPSGNS
jgi:Zn-dependent protease/CBS domain-containing protein